MSTILLLAMRVSEAVTTALRCALIAVGSELRSSLNGVLVLAKTISLTSLLSELRTLFSCMQPNTVNVFFFRQPKKCSSPNLPPGPNFSIPMPLLCCPPDSEDVHVMELCNRCADNKATIENLISIAESVGMTYPGEQFEPCQLCYDRAVRLHQLEVRIRENESLVEEEYDLPGGDDRS
mmetsp:Transcript_39906/g.106613  ORF Transcript_39906/g.106613 Transcript_39906/m.106613 type:complete len:179 (+) Transcript_39906:285-821(+)